LSADHKRQLKAAGATDLRSIAQALQSAATIEAYNTGVQLRKKEKTAKSLGTPVAFSLSAAQADDIRNAVAKAVAKSLQGTR